MNYFRRLNKNKKKNTFVLNYRTSFFKATCFFLNLYQVLLFFFEKKKNKKNEPFPLDVLLLKNTYFEFILKGPKNSVGFSLQCIDQRSRSHSPIAISDHDHTLFFERSAISITPTDRDQRFHLPKPTIILWRSQFNTNILVQIKGFFYSHRYKRPYKR